MKRSTACDQKHTAVQPSYPAGFDNIPKIWEQNKRATYFSIEYVTNGIVNELFNCRVPGLKGTKIQVVIDHLQQQGCLSFPYGGCVRDQFSDGVMPADLDMETNCAREKFRQICTAKWGAENCVHGHAAEHIGQADANDGGNTDILDAANWEETFFGDGTELEYTTNSMAFLASGKNYIIDLTGHGISDTCEKKIRIPVDDEQMYGKWKADGTVIFRYWKLRVKGYTAAVEKQAKYIKSQLLQMIGGNKAKFQKLYCKYALKGKWNEKCVMSNCNLEMKEKYDSAFVTDFPDGLQAIQEATARLHCDSCPKANPCNQQ